LAERQSLKVNLLEKPIEFDAALIFSHIPQKRSSRHDLKKRCARMQCAQIAHPDSLESAHARSKGIS
jgi:hypothetical protein